MIQPLPGHALRVPTRQREQGFFLKVSMADLLFRGISAVLFNNKDGAFHVACQMAGNGTHEKALESAAAPVAHDDQVAVFFQRRDPAGRIPDCLHGKSIHEEYPRE